MGQLWPNWQNSDGLHSGDASHWFRNGTYVVLAEMDRAQFARRRAGGEGDRSRAASGIDLGAWRSRSRSSGGAGARAIPQELPVGSAARRSDHPDRGRDGIAAGNSAGKPDSRVANRTAEPIGHATERIGT